MGNELALAVNTVSGRNVSAKVVIGIHVAQEDAPFASDVWTILASGIEDSSLSEVVLWHLGTFTSNQYMR